MKWKRLSDMWLFPGLLGTTSWRANPVGWWSNFHLRQPFQQPPFRGRGSFHFSHHSSSSQRPRDLRMPDLYQTHQESFHQPFHHQWVSLSSNFQKEEEKSSFVFAQTKQRFFSALAASLSSTPRWEWITFQDDTASSASLWHTLSRMS